MRIFFAFFLYLLICMLISALVLPWLQPLIADWLGTPPDRSLYRFGMLLAALGLPLFLRRLGLNSRPLMGWQPPPSGVRVDLLRGLGLGVAMLALVTVILLLGGVRQPQSTDLSLGRIFSALTGGFVSGIAAGLLEEFFFRGPLQGGMRRSLPFWPSALLIGLFYAMVHFVRPTPLQGPILDIRHSLGMFIGGLAHLREFPLFADSFFALVAAGVFLSMLRERTGSLAMAVGTHAGWILMIRLLKHTTHINHSSPWIGLIGDYDNITGWLAAFVIALFSIGYWLKRPPPDGAVRASPHPTPHSRRVR